MSDKNIEHYFLNGGGEMGELIRAKDWSKTPLGDPKDWPQCLRTMVSVMLDNPFGMYIAWGKEYTQIYNDGYRPILGTTKHPKALGISTRETFSEIWHIIESMFEGVMNGVPVGFPDFKLELDRNGFVEICYFDFSYSPIRIENGEVGGVLVTVVETTNKKKAEDELKENKDQLQFAVDAAQLGTFDYNPLTNKFTANGRLKEWFGLPPENQIQLNDAISAIAQIDRLRVSTAIQKSLEYSSGGRYDIEYTIINPISKKETIVHAKGRAWFNEQKIAYRLNGTLEDVTEQTLAWRKTAQSEQMIRNMVLEAPIGICVMDAHTLVNEIVNERFVEIAGKPYESIVGKHYWDTFPEAKAHYEAALNNVVETGNPFYANELGIMLIRQGKEETIHVTFVYAPLKGEDGKVSKIAVWVVDNTMQVVARQKVEESAKQFTTLANSIQNLAWMANADGWIYWYNDRWYDYTGTTPEEMEGWGWQSVHDPEQLPVVLKKWQQSIASGEAFEMVFPLKGKDNVFRPFLTLIYPLRDGDGKVIRWIGTNTDISVQKEAEEQFRQMAERIPQKVWTADAQGNRNYFNQVMLDYTGLTFDELKDWGWEKLVHPEDLPKTKQIWEHSINTGEDLVNEYRLLRKDGKYLWHLVRATAIKDEKGKPKMWIGSKTEIQEQVELSETLWENLKRSNNRMQTILHHAPDAVISIDEDGIIRNWNPEAENIFGWKESEAIGKTLTETIMPQRYHNSHESGIKHFLKTGEGPIINKPVELSAIKKNGGEFPIELKISTSQINDRYIFIGFIRDISIRKLAEETIQNKTNQLMEAQQLAHMGSWEWDVLSNKIEWSDELFRIYGLTPQEFEASYESFLTYTHPDDREYVNNIVQQAYRDHQPFKFFQKIVRVDGQIRIISATGKVNTDGMGNVVKMSGTAQDVTEQKKYEEELKISEERFFKIFDSNPVPMSLAEIQTNKIKYANNHFFNAFGYTKEEVIGYSSDELNLIDPEEYKRVVDVIFGYLHENRSLAEVQALSKEETEELLLKLKQSEKMKDFEILYTRKNGETFPAIVSYEVIRIGTESYTVTSYQDITERKKAEALLKNQNEQLEKMNKELESFAYISSHDLQEPLRKIQTFASQLTEKEAHNLSDKGKDKFQRMQNAAHRMQTLIQDLLAYSRTTTHERTFDLTNLNNIVEDVKEDLKEELQQKNARIEIDGEICEIKIIPFQFRQLLFNLIGNSLKFAQENQAPHIRITCVIREGALLDNNLLSKETTYCYIKIVDNGIGFEQEYSDKIFEVFQRLHEKNKYNGTGIGLAIVKKIVENHNGVISAKGELNKGATFDIYIPIS